MQTITKEQFPSIQATERQPTETAGDWRAFECANGHQSFADGPDAAAFLQKTGCAFCEASLTPLAFPPLFTLAELPPLSPAAAMVRANFLAARRAWYERLCRDTMAGRYGPVEARAWNGLGQVAWWMDSVLRHAADAWWTERAHLAPGDHRFNFDLCSECREPVLSAGFHPECPAKRRQTGGVL